jgi:diguanylate cyclase (GGDEF)-like protein
VKHHRWPDNQQALYDDLTGLPNRRLLMQQIIGALTSARERGDRAAILCLTLDRFQQADDEHGQIVRDKCLKRVATMLTRRLRGMDTVARTGEEEFTIVLGEVESVGAVGMVAKALMELFAIPLEVEQCQMLLRVSIGGAVYPDHAKERRSYGRTLTPQCAVLREMEVAVTFWQHGKRVRTLRRTWSLRTICARCCRRGDFACTISCSIT